jgi:hypothetical protein
VSPRERLLNRDKRASLSSNLLAKDALAASDDESGAVAGSASPGVLPPRPAVSELRQTAEGADATASDAVLYSKGAASASGFRPWYWSFDRDATTQSSENSATITPFPGSAPTPATPAGAADTAPPRAAKMTMYVVGGFSALALIASSALFILSRSQDPVPYAAVAPVTTAAEVVTVPVRPGNDAGSVAANPERAAAVAQKTAENRADDRGTTANAEPAKRPVATEPRTTTEALPPLVAVEAPRATAAAPLSPQEIADLVARGDQLLATGDIVAARVFYERAAEQGSASAATAVGKTYDPLVLDELHVRGIRGDPVMAAKWYRRASAGGDLQADFRMQKLIAKYAG